MRVTFNSQYREAANAVETSSARLIDAQRRVSSGRRFDKISDDPTAAATSIAERSNLSQVEQYTRAADSVASRLSVVDTALSDVIEKLTAAQTAATAARGTTKTAAEREAVAQQLMALRDSLLDNLNTSFHGTYIFGGASATVAPYSVPAGGTVHTYAGDSTEVQVEIGDGRVVTIAFNGGAITQGSEPQDLFASMNDLIAAVSAGDDDAIGTGLQQLRRGFERATAAQTRIGNDMQVIDAQKMRLQQMKLSGSERLSKLEHADMAEAITEMTHAESAYRATLGAVSTMSRVSLLDYLK